MSIVDVHGNPMSSVFTAGSRTKNTMATWNPSYVIEDENLEETEYIHSRTLDLFRNDPIISGAMAAKIDSTVGHSYNPIFSPVYSNRLPVKREDLEAWADDVESFLQEYINSQSRWIDAKRRSGFTGLIREQLANVFVEGDSFNHRVFREDRRSQLSTAFNIIQPSRIESGYDMDKFKHGIRTDRYGAATAYSVRTNRQDGQSWEVEYKKYPKYKYATLPNGESFQFQQIYHYFMPVGGSRRGVSVLASVVEVVKQSARYTDLTLEKAILGATFGMAITSEFSPEAIMNSMGNHQDNALLEGLKQYEELLGHANTAKKLNVGGTHAFTLAPNEDIKPIQGNDPTASHASFMMEQNRKMALGAEMSYENATGDYSQVNFAASQSSLQREIRTIKRNKELLCDPMAQDICTAVITEMVLGGHIGLPKGLDKIGFLRHKDALTKCTFVGAAMVHPDPLKQKKAAKMSIALGATSPQQVAAQDGNDYREVCAQNVKAAKAKIKAIEEGLGMELSDDQKLNILGAV